MGWKQLGRVEGDTTYLIYNRRGFDEFCVHEEGRVYEIPRKVLMDAAAEELSAALINLGENITGEALSGLIEATRTLWVRERRC